MVACPATRTTPWAIPARPAHMAITPKIALRWILEPLPSDWWRRHKVYTEIQISLPFSDHNPFGFFEFSITTVHIQVDRFDFTQVLIRFHLFMHVLQLQFQMSQASLGDHHVCPPACYLRDVVF